MSEHGTTKQDELHPGSSIVAIRDEIQRLEDPRMRAVNEKQGNDYGINLTKLRAMAKALKTNQELAEELWQSGESTLRLLALLTCRPKAFSQEQLDAWLREARVPKVQDWLLSYVVKKSKFLEPLRQLWIADRDPVIASAGWELTAHQVIKAPQLLDLAALLDTIEEQMTAAPERLQWSMNTTLAQIGINHPEHRERALAIGNRLQVLAHYPTSPGCTSPFAPEWINEMVRRQQAAAQ